jgi:hypothetical protein
LHRKITEGPGTDTVKGEEKRGKKITEKQVVQGRCRRDMGKLKVGEEKRKRKRCSNGEIYRGLGKDKDRKERRGKEVVSGRCKRNMRKGEGGKRSRNRGSGKRWSHRDKRLTKMG